jgi:hypothetical protein
MKRVYLLVEGQTEETFVRDLLVPHYARIDLFLRPIVVRTSRSHVGGLRSYAKVKDQLIRLCRQDRDATVSTMMDLYGLPADFPGKSSPAYPRQGAGVQKAGFIEAEWAKDVNESNFLPHLMVHEFEALLFVEPDRFSGWATSGSVVAELVRIARSSSSPEEINDGPATAPSKRIMQFMPEFEKTFHGPLIATEIGLDALQRGCAHFSAWLGRLEALVHPSR